MLNKDYLYTDLYRSIDEFVPEQDSCYLYGYSPEERSHCVDKLISRENSTSVKYVRISEKENDIISESMTTSNHNLRSTESILKFLNNCRARTLYIDVTGLSNRICASLINNAIKAKGLGYFSVVKTVYAEPETYDIKQFKSEGVFNDLSEKIDGIEPLPGFATIIPENMNDVELVALLGFEGGRFMHILESVQPPRGNVIPIIGVPGFRLEYPFVAYWGNRRPLEQTDTWRNIVYSPANSLVDVYLHLTKILKKSSGKIKLAPIGTKPHAIGAVLFAIKNPKDVELVYDNPKRIKQRTDGVGKIVECNVSQLLDEN